MKSPRRRQGTMMDRVLAVAFVAFFIYLLYLAMNGRLDSEVSALANWLKQLFT